MKGDSHHLSTGNWENLGGWVLCDSHPLASLVVLTVSKGYPKGLQICLSHCPSADGPWGWNGWDVLQGETPGHPPSCRWGDGWNVTCPRGMPFPLFPSPYLLAEPGSSTCKVGTCIGFQVFNLCSER